MRRVQSATGRGRNLFTRRLPGALVVGVVAIGVGAGLGCGAASDVSGGLPLATIADCEDMGGVPLFDPGDGRPLASSCPDGLEAIAEFDEDFYGSQGGVCCTSDDGDGAGAPEGEPVGDEPLGDEPLGVDDGASDER